MMSPQTWSSILALSFLLGSGLVAGIFFAFSTFVLKALGRVAPSEGLASMQSINFVVLNPWFLGLFFVTAVLGILAMVSGFSPQAPVGAVWLLLGAFFYLFGCFLVTVVVHVPANQALAEISQKTPEWEELWRLYLKRWMAWNHVRTMASFLAAVAVGVFLLKNPAALPTPGG